MCVGAGRGGGGGGGRCLVAVGEDLQGKDAALHEYHLDAAILLARGLANTAAKRAVLEAVGDVALQPVPRNNKKLHRQPLLPAETLRQSG